MANALRCDCSVCADESRPRLKYDCLQNTFHILTKNVHGMNYVTFPNSYFFPVVDNF